MAVYEKSKSVKLKSISTMTEGTIWRQILLFSIPLILGNLLQQMYNTVDSIIVGNLWAAMHWLQLVPVRR